MNKRDLKNATIGFLSAALLFSGANFIGAYFTDAEVTKNEFTVGDVSIEALETEYPGNDSNIVKNMTANQEVPKNPTANNKGVNDAVIFVTVDSPMENITVVSNTGARSAKEVSEIFWYKKTADGIEKHENNFNTGTSADTWTELTTKEMYLVIAASGAETKYATLAEAQAAYATMPATSKLVKRYVFGYNSQIQGSDTTDGDSQTAANKVTTAVFDKLQLKNVIENEIDETPEEVVIRTFAIQADNIIDGNTVITPSATGTYSAAQLGTIYDMFIIQNSVNNDNTGTQVNPANLRPADSVVDTQNGASGTTDSHTNRWDTDTDVSGEGQHVKP